MIPMLRKALSDIRWTAFWFAIAGAGYTLLVALFYPIVREQSKTFAALIATYPKGVLTALGYTDITTFTGFLGAESLNLFWPIIVGVFATLAGASLVAKEVEDGTSETWLSIPAARWRLLLGKMGALAIGLLGAVVACAVTVAVSGALDNVNVSVSGLLAMAVVMTAFLFAIAAYTGVLSSLASSRGVAAGTSFGITLVSYVLWVIAGLSDKWKVLKDFSIFTAYSPQKALETGTVDGFAISALIAVTAVCVVVALFAFQRRDAI